MGDHKREMTGQEVLMVTPAGFSWSYDDYTEIERKDYTDMKFSDQ